MDSVPPLLVHFDHGGVEPEQGEDVDDVPIDDELEQEPPPIQPPQDWPRRSIRDSRPSNRQNNVTLADPNNGFVR
ncbi:hypothetical protein ACH5RR_026333 [Cinchona calisaya]|uniref:Uncharacterized protein n=1 Tax=Cinchona calisaya TaxID=153742 RepID=A0ABD2Z2I5_9GENT